MAPRVLSSTDLAGARLIAIRIALAKGCSPEDAEDIAQTGLERLLCQDPPPDNPDAWVTRTARNLVADHYRRRRPATTDERPDALAAFVRLAAPTSLEGMADVTRRQLESHLARVLTDRELRVAALKADGLSLAEIAERLGYANAATVKTTLARIRVKLAALTAELVEFRGHPRPY
ncbi:MAG: sigma-70 family RNA polymerase sigma factor [Actinobacteria bacterium]|nr:MAG: sigma-70 family RNA polymerase sigma factor [Actinomycetota bacterium]